MAPPQANAGAERLVAATKAMRAARDAFMGEAPGGRRVAWGCVGRGPKNVTAKEERSSRPGLSLPGRLVRHLPARRPISAPQTQPPAHGLPCRGRAVRPDVRA